MTRFRVVYESGFNSAAEARQVFRERMAEARERLQDRPLQPWERPEHTRIRAAVPEQVRLCDDPVLAAWVATRESLADWRLAMRVELRFPVVEVMERGHVFDREAAAQALADLRAGKAVATATVVRLARHRLETE